MSDHQNQFDYVQLRKLYDECLDYLNENREDLQTIIETEEPDYETIKELQSNGNHETVQGHNDINNCDNENPVKSINDLDKVNLQNSNTIPNHDDDKKIIDSEKANDSDLLYETLNPAVKLSDDKVIEIKTEHGNNNRLALVKYDESQCILYETLNPNVSYVNSASKEEDIQIVINNNQLKYNATELNDNRNDSHESLDHVSEEPIDERKIIVKSNLQNLKKHKPMVFEEGEKSVYEKSTFKLENELKSLESLGSVKSERLRKLSQQLPKIVITSSNTSLDMTNNDRIRMEAKPTLPRVDKMPIYNITRTPQAPRTRKAYGEFPKRLVSKTGLENVALISNVPFEKIRLLNDTFHTLINLRWRWIVIGTVVVHFLIWLVFAMFWYITALAHYDFEPDPPKRSCVTGGKDFVTIFLASVEAQTTIGFGDRAIDEECPEAIFLFIMQLILGTGLSGVLTCVVYAKLTRPEKLSRDGVGFSKKAVISMRDGRLCLMIRAWDLNYDHIISSEFTAHFINTHKTKEGEIIRYYAQRLSLQHRQFLLWPVTLVHVIDQNSPLYKYGPDVINHSSYEITVSLKGASASMGTFTQSQTSYVPKEVLWGHRFPPVVRYDGRKQKYVIDHTKLDMTEAVDTPHCSAEHLNGTNKQQSEIPIRLPSTPSSFSDKMSVFQLERTSSFRKKKNKS